MAKQHPRDLRRMERGVHPIAPTAVDDDHRTVGPGHREPPATQQESIAAREGNVLVCRGDRRGRWLERQSVDPGNAFRDTEGDPEVDRQSQDERPDEQNRPSRAALSEHATNVSACE